MVRGTDRPAMTIAVDLGRKATKQTNKNLCPRISKKAVKMVAAYQCPGQVTLTN